MDGVLVPTVIVHVFRHVPISTGVGDNNSKLIMMFWWHPSGVELGRRILLY